MTRLCRVDWRALLLILKWTDRHDEPTSIRRMVTFNSTSLHQKGFHPDDVPALPGHVVMCNSQNQKGFHPYDVPALTGHVVTLNSTDIHQKNSCFLNVPTSCSREIYVF